MNNLRQELQETPLTLYGQNLKEKEKEKYLGDMIHSAGNAASVDATVDDRTGKIVSFIIQARAIIADCRMNKIGGLTAGIDIWELAYLPNLLNNSESWIDIEETTIKKLDNLQISMYKTILNCPGSNLHAAMLWELGGVKMRYRIMQKRLNFLLHIKSTYIRSM